MYVPAPAGTAYYFACQRWFSRDHEDGAIERTLAASLIPPDASTLNTYTAEVHTSSLRGAGTDASVALQLFGAQGDSGMQRLKVSAYTTTMCPLLVLSTVAKLCLRVQKPAGV